MKPKDFKKIIKKLTKGGFELKEIFSPSYSKDTPKEQRPKILAVWGDRISILLKRVLAEQNYQRLINQLVDTDRYREGPYCICFNRDGRKIYIINRGVFMDS